MSEDHVCEMICPYCNKAIKDNEDEVVKEGANDDYVVHAECNNQREEETQFHSRISFLRTEISEVIKEYNSRRLCNREIESPELMDHVTRVQLALFALDFRQ